MQDNFDSIISRNTLFWLLITNVAVLSPQFEHATPWTTAICAICFVWRMGIYYGKDLLKVLLFMMKDFF